MSLDVFKIKVERLFVVMCDSLKCSTFHIVQNAISIVMSDTGKQQFCTRQADGNNLRHHTTAHSDVPVSIVKKSTVRTLRGCFKIQKEF